MNAHYDMMIPRKLLHILVGIAIPLMYLVSDKKTALVLTGVLFLLQAIFDVLRVKGLVKIGIVDRNSKEEEKRKPQGSLYYVLGCFITIAFFEKQIAVASIFVLAIADPLSSIIGGKFGRFRFFGKSLEGAMTFFLCSFIILRLFSFDFPVAAICAVVASLVEYFSSRLIDDNLSIPIVAASALTLLRCLPL